MGMFDTVLVEVPLPDGYLPVEANGEPVTFQTKDLDCTMTTYRIAAPGLLLEEQWEAEPTPEDTADAEAAAERALLSTIPGSTPSDPSVWGTNTRPSPLAGLFGILKRTGARVWTQSSYTGEITFYSTVSRHGSATRRGGRSRRQGAFVEFVATFFAGRLESIRVEDRRPLFGTAPGRAKVVSRRGPTGALPILAFPAATASRATGDGETSDLLGAELLGTSVAWVVPGSADGDAAPLVGEVLDVGASWLVVQPQGRPLPVAVAKNWIQRGTTSDTPSHEASHEPER